MKLLQVNITPSNKQYLVTALVEIENSIKCFQQIQNEINSDSLLNAVDYGLTLDYDKAAKYFVHIDKKAFLNF